MFEVAVERNNVIRVVCVMASTPFEAIQRAMWDKECYLISKDYNDYKVKKK